MLLQDAHEGDKAAREQLVRENMGLVYAAVQRFAGRRSCEKEDLIQIGSIGLMKAIDRFDLTYEVCFSTYAVPMIVGEIRRFLRDDGMIRVSRALKEDAVKAYRAREELERENGCEPTLEEVAARAGLTPDEVVLALEAAAEVESLNKPVGEGDGASLVLGDRLMDQRDDTETLLNRMLAGQLLARERPDYKQNKRQILAEIEEQARALLAQMGLSDRENHYPHQLSGGQQQRVAIARALALHPDILCFDEPTSALDPELTGEVLRVLRELAAHRTTMIIVTHEMKFARDVADRILFMDGGVVVEQGSAKDLIDHPKEERTRQFLASYGK